MIIAKPVGGLANQMGVYAAAKSLALHHDVPLKLDTRHCEEGTLIEYRLHYLDLNVEIATEEEIKKVVGSSGIGFVDKVKKKLNKKFGLPTWGEYKEKGLNFDQSFYDLPSSVYLLGNFPSILYYEKIVDVIREEFQVVSEGSASTKVWEKKITQTPDSVSVHIRRGDYKNPKTQAFHGLLGIDYFERAINHMRKSLGQPEFFIFSDEIEWVKENLIVDAPIHYVDCHSPYEGHLDFRLMQKCDHFITSNSGFSRWPAYLSNNPEKIVCIPENWFVNNIINDEEIAPMNWIRL